MGLKIESLRVSLGGSSILQGIDLEIPKGCVFSLLGPSGCGKSTLLKSIAGLIPTGGGRICWEGEPIDRLPPEKRGMVMVFQDLRLFPHMSILDNVAFPLKMAGEGRADRRAAAERMLEMVQLEGLGRRRPSELSGGQQQRAALARALVARPRALLLDEPFSSLDAPLRADMRALVRRLHGELGTTMLLVTHDREEALALSGLMAVMAPGRILQTGAPRELYEHPASLDVARHFFSGSQAAGNVSGGRFTGGGLDFPAPGVPDGPAAALLPPDGFEISADPNGAFAVQAMEYAGDCVRATVACGEAVLQAAVPLDSGMAAGSRVNVRVDRALVFPRE